MFLLLRILLGGVLLVSGVEKLISPYQNFMYAIQAYQILPSFGEELVARLLPWVELIIGLFVVLGFWTRQALCGAMILYMLFIVVVGQALLRGLMIDECGCLGQLIHIPPRVIIVMDSAFVLVSIAALKNLARIKQVSLDAYWDK